MPELVEGNGIGITYRCMSLPKAEVSENENITTKRGFGRLNHLETTVVEGDGIIKICLLNI